MFLLLSVSRSALDRKPAPRFSPLSFINKDEIQRRPHTHKSIYVKPPDCLIFGISPNRYAAFFGLRERRTEMAKDFIGRPATEQVELTGQRLSAATMAIVERSKTKAELLQFFCAMKWGFEVVAVEHTALDAIAAVRQTEPNVILAGLENLETNAVDLVSELRLTAPSAKIIGIISHCSEYLIHAIATSDCHGLICDTDESLLELGQAIERVRSGLRSVSARIVQCQTALRTNPDGFPKLLSDREQQVLICIAHSLSDDEIASQLKISTDTALSHRKKIMRKLNIHSTPKLIAYCLDKGFSAAGLPALHKARDIR